MLWYWETLGQYGGYDSAEGYMIVFEGAAKQRPKDEWWTSYLYFDGEPVDCYVSEARLTCWEYKRL